MTKLITICSTFLLLLITVACDNSTTNATPEEEVKNNITEKKEDSASKKLVFEGRVATDDLKEATIRIDIYKKGEKSVFQTLNNLDLPYQEGNPAFDKPTFEDLNFDGMPDLRVPESVGNANIYYAYWIYNPAIEKFERNTEMNLSLPRVDAAQKQITSFERNSAASSIETTYMHQDGKFLVLRIENKDYRDENTYQSVVKERQEDGTMKEVRNELVEEAEG